MLVEETSTDTKGNEEMNAKQVIRNAIPNASDGLCEMIIWGRTGFPCFGDVNAKVIYKAAKRWYRAVSKGNELCEFCDSFAVKNHLCDSCRNALSRCSESVSVQRQAPQPNNPDGF